MIFDQNLGVLALFSLAKHPQESTKMSYFRIAMKTVGFGRDLTNGQEPLDEDSDSSGEISIVW